MSKPNAIRLVLIGCGNMGGALLRSWLESSLNLECTIVERNMNTPNVPLPPARTHKKAAPLIFNRVRYPSYCEEELKNADIVVLAVKPQAMAKLCGELKPVLPEDTAIISIAAGLSISNFEQWFSPAQPIIRAMPNTPASIGKSMTVATANANVSTLQKDIADVLFSCAGLLEWVEDENLLHAVTALSGSGPAYVFYMIEALTKAGTDIGLPQDLAETLARQTVIGSAALAEAEPTETAATLRKNVTSPGGTTEAGLEVLMNGKFDKILKETLAASLARCKELDQS